MLRQRAILKRPRHPGNHGFAKLKPAWPAKALPSSTRLIERIAKVDHCLLTHFKQAFLRSFEIRDEKHNCRERQNKRHHGRRPPETAQSLVIADSSHSKTRHEVECRPNDARNAAP